LYMSDIFVVAGVAQYSHLATGRPTDILFPAETGKGFVFGATSRPGVGPT